MLILYGSLRSIRIIHGGVKQELNVQTKNKEQAAKHD